MRHVARIEEMENGHRILIKPKGKRPIVSLSVHWRTADIRAWIEIIWLMMVINVRLL
jgi:hypothetical protein